MDYTELYAQKKMTAEQAAALVKSGDWVDYGWAVNTPVAVDAAIAKRLPELENVNFRGGILMWVPEIFQIDDPAAHMTWNSWHMSGIERKAIAQGFSFYSPIRYSELPRYYRDSTDPVDVAVFQVTPMDEHGYFNFGPSASHLGAVCEKAKKIIVEVNTNMPRCLGGTENWVHISQGAGVVEGNNPPLGQMAAPGAATEVDLAVANLIVPQIPNGACLQLGIGGMPNTIGNLIAQSDLKDLGVHTEMYVDAFVDIAKAGKITGRHKNLDKGRQVYAFGAGTQKMYDYLDNNPECMAAPVEYTNDIRSISALDNFISINNAVDIDLFGQVNAESAGIKHISGAGGKQLHARLIALDGERVSLSDQAQADAAKARVEQGGFVIRSVKRGEKRKHPAPPFTTSNLQQEASRKLGFTTAKTMQIAQQLYEGVDIEGRGTLGLISYIRTDSVRLSDEAVAAAREAIAARYGAEYVPEKPNVYKGRKSAQDAHEAIRPANIDLRPEEIKASLTKDQFNLYKLVYLRFVACQMADALYETQQIEIASESGAVLRSSAERLKFAGFTAVYEEGTDDAPAQDEAQAGAMADVNEGDKAELLGDEATQHFTQAPPRYTEASLVRALEEKGIGRPSTYAPTISTILARGYVMREKKQLFPTELGIMITNMMEEYFADIVDIAFTAGMEEQLDEVEEGKLDWHKVLSDFYGPFEKTLENAEAKIEKVEIKDEVSDVPCDKCGAMMVYKLGRYGRFLACPNFPDCRNTKAIQIEIDAPCPKCGGKLLQKTSRKGRKFYGCERYPECDFVSWEMPVREKCPKCGSYMTLSRTKKGDFYVCANETCRERIPAPQEENE